MGCSINNTDTNSRPAPRVSGHAPVLQGRSAYQSATTPSFQDTHRSFYVAVPKCGDHNTEFATSAFIAFTVEAPAA